MSHIVHICHIYLHIACNALPVVLHIEHIVRDACFAYCLQCLHIMQNTLHIVYIFLIVHIRDFIFILYFYPKTNSWPHGTLKTKAPYCKWQHALRFFTTRGSYWILANTYDGNQTQDLRIDIYMLYNCHISPVQMFVIYTILDMHIVHILHVLHIQ